MRKFKIAYWVTIGVFLLLFFVQNQEFLMEKKSLSWNIISISALAKAELKPFMDYKTPELQLILFFLAYFAAGVLLTLFYSFVMSFKFKRTINNLSRTLDKQRETIDELQSELDALRGGGTTPLVQKELVDVPSDDDDDDNQ